MRCARRLSAILRTGEWFGAGHLIDILTGNATAKVRERGHDSLPTFAVGRDMSKPAWGAVFRQMMGRDLVRPDPDRLGALRMTDAARPILRGEASDHAAARYAGNRASPSRWSGPRSLTRTPMLLSALKAKRRSAGRGAEGAGLCGLSRPDPDRDGAKSGRRRLDQMMGITGVGAKKLESYGAAFLEVITGAGRGACIRRGASWRGSEAGQVFDRLAEVQLELARGEDGTGKPLSLHPLHPAPDRRTPPRHTGRFGRIQGMGEQKLERFGAAFLAVLRERLRQAQVPVICTGSASDRRASDGQNSARTSAMAALRSGLVM